MIKRKFFFAIMLLLMAFPLMAQTTTLNTNTDELDNGLLIRWEPTADSNATAFTEDLDLSGWDNSDTLTAYYSIRGVATLPDTATVGGYIIHLINNYNPESLDDWKSQDTITITTTDLSVGTIALTKAAFHKFKFLNSAYLNTYRLGIYLPRKD